MKNRVIGIGVGITAAFVLVGSFEGIPLEMLISDLGPFVGLAVWLHLRLTEIEQQAERNTRQLNFLLKPIADLRPRSTDETEKESR